jgi:hypothetical protein
MFKLSPFPAVTLSVNLFPPKTISCDLLLRVVPSIHHGIGHGTVNAVANLPQIARRGGTFYLKNLKFKRQKGDKCHMPGQGRALDGAEGARVFEQFKEYAKPFMAANLMPLTPATKAKLRDRYLQLYNEAGGLVCVCPV